MRIWDVPCAVLCRAHLLGEHRELHAIHSILTNDWPGYRRHPEVLRWEGRLPALRSRHVEQVTEMEARGYSHDSPLIGPAFGPAPEPWEAVSSQINKLRAKGCACRV